MKWLWFAVALLYPFAGCSSEQAAQASPSAAKPREPILSADSPPPLERPRIGSYSTSRNRADRRRVELATQWKQRDRQASLRDEIEQEVIDFVLEISGYWLGTRWGLGAPQTGNPHVGKINCGTFVGTVLRDAGFNVNVKKLQRQPSQLIIASFVSGDRVKKFSDRSMDGFLATVKRMGPGLFIIGLDFHVGFLVQTENDLRFIHASFETETVVDEPAATAMPITTSRYRVVGKLLTRKNIDDWLRGREIRVKGKW